MPDDYELDEQISSTESAQVWLAGDPSGASIVLKLAAKESRVERRFKREIEALEIAAGQHVMPILGYDDSHSWYSMPVAVQTLYETSVPTSFDDCVQVLEAITAALAPIHSLGLVHRDLKPQNILWLDDGFGARWVVADFGIVRNAPGVTTEQLTHVGGLTGSKGWAAPEQYRDAHGEDRVVGRVPRDRQRFSDPATVRCPTTSPSSAQSSAQPGARRGRCSRATRDRTLRLEPLSHDLQTELIQAPECGQVRASEGSVRHVEVSGWAV